MKKELYSQRFIDKFLKSKERNECNKRNVASNIFHLLAIVENIDSALAQLSDSHCVSEELKKLKKECLASVENLDQAVLENSLEEIQEQNFQQVVPGEVDASSAKEASGEDEDKAKIKKQAIDTFYKAIVEKRLIDKFIANNQSLPVVKSADKQVFYTAPIKIVKKESDEHNDEHHIVVFHTKVLSIDIDQLMQVDRLPFISHGISDEGTFTRFPELKDQIPHSSYTLFSSSLNRVVDGSGIVELAGMKKIVGLDVVDEDLCENGEKAVAKLSQSGAPSGAKTSLAGWIKALDTAGKTMSVHVTEKANGAYAACQVFKGPDDQDLLFVSSKASPLILPIPKVNSVEQKKKLLLEALKTLKEKRASEKRVLEPLLEFIATESIKQLSECKSGDLFDPDHSFWQRGMCVGEAELGDHIIPLAADAAPTIRWFKQINSGPSVSIQGELESLKSVGLTTVKHYSVAIDDLRAKEKELRRSENLEGVVFYFIVNGRCYQIKYKSIPYIIHRALRQFLNNKIGKELLSLSWSQQGTVLSSANRPKHVDHVIAYFLDNHPHLLALSKNTEFCSIVQENIQKCKRDFPRFIQFLLDKGCSEKDLEYGNDYGFARLYQEFNKRQTQAKGEMIKVTESSTVSMCYGGVIIALSGPPGVGKDHLAQKLAENEGWKNNKPLILSKDLAGNAVSTENSRYKDWTESQKATHRLAWLSGEINKAVQAKRPIIATTCNGSDRELAWITSAAKAHNLAVMLVYPHESLEDRTAFSAALIVSVLRRKSHPTLSASTGGVLDSKFAQVIMSRLNDGRYTYASEKADYRIPASDCYPKFLETQLLSYFKLSSFAEFMRNTDLSEEQGKIKDALEEVVNFIEGKKEISIDSLTVLYNAKKDLIDKIFERISADHLSQQLMNEITQLKGKGVDCQPQKGTVRALEDQATYYGAFLDGESAEKLKAAVNKYFPKQELDRLSWINTYIDSNVAERDETLPKKSNKQGADRDRFLHLTLAHADLLHMLSDEASSELKNMVEENSNNGAKVSLEVRSISYNEGVIYLSDVRLLYQNKNGDIEDKTKLLVASGMPHITLVTRDRTPAVFALYAEQRRQEEMKGGEVIKAEDRLIKTISLDETLVLEASVNTDLQYARIYNEKRGRALGAAVKRGKRGKFDKARFFSVLGVEEENNPNGGSASSPASLARIHCD